MNTTAFRVSRKYFTVGVSGVSGVSGGAGSGGAGSAGSTGPGGDSRTAPVIAAPRPTAGTGRAAGPSSSPRACRMVTESYRMAAFREGDGE
jgi:hypothetical protein